MMWHSCETDVALAERNSAAPRDAEPALRVLLIAYHFPPSAASGAFRLLGFSRHLPRFGWQVAAVAPVRIPWEPLDPALADRLPEGMPVTRVPYPSGLFTKPARRLAPYGAWLPKAWPACLQMMRTFRPHVVLTSGPPHCVHALGARIKRRFGVSWFADFRDPWITNGQPLKRLSPKARLLLAWERRVIERADAVVLNAPRACQIIQAAYPKSADKMLTITNGFDPEAFDLGDRSAPAEDGKRCLLHTGELYAGRDPRPLFDALKTLIDENPRIAAEWRVRFVGQVTAKCFESGFDLAGEIERRGLARVVELAGQMPYRQTLEAMCDADALLLVDSPGRRMGVPAKLYEYLGAGRPVLALAEEDGDSAWVLKRSGVAHRLAAPNDAARIRRALGELLSIAAIERANPREAAACGEFSREQIAARLAEAMRRSVQSAAPRAWGRARV